LGVIFKNHSLTFPDILPQNLHPTNPSYAGVLGNLLLSVIPTSLPFEATEPVAETAHCVCCVQGTEAKGTSGVLRDNLLPSSRKAPAFFSSRVFHFSQIVPAVTYVEAGSIQL
jgi:hypothetical protein